MTDPSTVLSGQTIAYTLYVIVILLLIAWFAHQITRGAGKSFVKPALFYSFVAFLVVLGVSLHLVTHATIPWKPIDLNRDTLKADRAFNITIRDHEIILPAATLNINKGELVSFNVTSDDLTYGFGLFRQDNTMLFQMQVLPGHVNNIMWKFERPEILSIRSTEYSGWKGNNMLKKDAVIVK